MHLSLRIPRACIDSLFLIYTAVRVDSAEDLFIIYIYQIPLSGAAFQRVLVFQSELEQHVLRLLHRPDISFHLSVSLVDLEGFEPPTFKLWVCYSYQLNYRSELPSFDYCQGVANPYTWSFLFYGREKNRTSAFASSNFTSLRWW